MLLSSLGSRGGCECCLAASVVGGEARKPVSSSSDGNLGERSHLLL